ncbi:TonB-dependent receptor [Bryobacter aggregatus]|uniref:TonB-dependent receptor n=1 Tax=Bryobacter aggregatus TaxID=360054 RepID=UPI00138E0240|nr:TonB-dependent receptor [Bryobacter aggregatus]
MIASLLCSYEPIHAQVLSGSLVGNVTDSSGAAVAGAIVKITEGATGQTRELEANSSGTYTISTIPPGTYTVSIAKAGFRSHVASSVIVRLNTVVRVDAVLEVGAVSDSVEISAQTAILQTDKADVHSDISSTSLQNIPQPTRTYQGMLALLPGIAPPSASSGGTNNPSKSMQITANGTSRSGTNFRIEGVSATNPWVQFFSSYVPSVEAIETVNVVTTSPDAEQGLAGGASVNVQLKSGTNNLHGSLYAYHINSATKARPFFMPASQGIPKLVNNDVGATLGGPFIKNKLFFFASYEADLIRQGSAQLTTVPTNDIRRGIMTASPNEIYDPASLDLNGKRTPFPNKTIPASRISPIVNKLVALVPQPNIAGALVSNYYVNTPILYDLHKLDTKFDWNTTSKLRVVGRFARQPYNNVQNTIFGEILGGSPNYIQNGSTIAPSGTVTYVASPNIVVDGTFGLQLVDQTLFPPGTDKKYGSDYLGIPGTNLGATPLYGGMPQFSVSTYSGYGYSYTPLQYKQKTFQYTGNVSWIKGSHNIRFGVDLNRQHMDHFEIAPTNFTFNGNVTSLPGGVGPNQFNSYGDFLLGLPVSYTNSRQTVPMITLRSWQQSLYIRDQWQATRKLTLSLGLRWEHYPVPTRADRGIERFDLKTNQYLICGVGPIPRDCGIKVSKLLFAPRVGIAYRPTESTVIRLGYALSPEQINMARDGISNYPVRVDYSATGVDSFTPVGTLAAGIPEIASPDISKGVIPLPPGASFSTNDEKYVRGYVQSANLTIQKTLPSNFVLSAGYVGTKTIHQHTRYNVNYGQVGGGAVSQPYYKLGITAAARVILPIVSMSYHSFQTTLDRRFSNGITFQASYTRSKWMGMCCSESGDGEPAIPIPEYRFLTRSLMPADRPNNLRISMLAELPFGKGKHFAQSSFASAILGGWRVNGVFSQYSGTPFSVSASGASLNAPGSTQRADQVKANVAINGSIASYFDPLAFAPVTAVRFGTAGYNSLRGPGVVNFDASIFRDFKITERFTAQIRAEALNATNTPHFSNPGANVSNLQLNPDGSVRNLGGFTQITSVSAPSRLTDERYFRFGFRLGF